MALGCRFSDFFNFSFYLLVPYVFSILLVQTEMCVVSLATPVSCFGCAALRTEELSPGSGSDHAGLGLESRSVCRTQLMARTAGEA